MTKDDVGKGVGMKKGKPFYVCTRTCVYTYVTWFQSKKQAIDLWRNATLLLPDEAMEKATL